MDCVHIRQGFCILMNFLKLNFVASLSFLFFKLHIIMCYVYILCKKNIIFISVIVHSSLPLFIGPWIVVGFSNGYVRLLDRRLTSNRTVVRQWREHTSWVISANLLNSSQATTKIITGV